MSKEEKLKRMDELIDKANSLKSHSNYENKALNSEWRQDVESALNHIFPDGGERIKKIDSIQDSLEVYVFGETEQDSYDSYESYADDIDSAIGHLKAWRNEIYNYHSQDQVVKNQDIKEVHMSKSCFIVHGHNDAIKFEVKDFINELSLNIKPIILHQKANEGKTVLEKFEKHSNVDFAVCIWSADDEGKSNKEADYNKRARQNVIIETGFFWGKLGREEVIILYEDGVEIPSDYKGFLYIPFKDNWKDDLRKEIQSFYK